MALALLLTGCGAEGTTATESAETQSTTTESRDTESTTTTTEATTTTAATTTTESMDTKVAAWAKDNATLVERLVETFNDAQSAASTADLPGLGVACMRMGVHAKEAQSRDPIPDAASNEAWQAAIAHFVEAAELCVDGVDRFDPDLLERAATELVAGSERIDDATQALGRFL